jgi:hypothetical protein
MIIICAFSLAEDTLSKIGPGKRIAERRAYLFDGLLLLCKPVTSLVTAVTHQTHYLHETRYTFMKCLPLFFFIAMPFQVACDIDTCICILCSSN